MDVGMPEDLERMNQPKRKPMRRDPGGYPYAPDTFKRCEVEFHNRVLEVLGRPQYNMGFLRGVIAGLHRGDYGRAYSYREIHEVIIPVYFVRNENYLRGRRNDVNVVSHFVSQINNGLLTSVESNLRRVGGPTLREKIEARKKAWLA